jgi:hypothetical protein
MDLMAMARKPTKVTSYTNTNATSASVERKDFIDQTIAIWQPRTKRQLTREDGREIIENMTGFFRILQEWNRTDRAEDASKS